MRHPRCSVSDRHPKPLLHVSSDRRGVWRVQAEGEPRALSEHASETDAERAAARHAAATGAHEIIVHDRYHRVHSVPPRQPGDIMAEHRRVIYTAEADLELLQVEAPTPIARRARR
jgi:hypothetical protein